MMHPSTLSRLSLFKKCSELEQTVKYKALKISNQKTILKRMEGEKQFLSAQILKLTSRKDELLRSAEKASGEAEDITSSFGVPLRPTTF